MIIDLDQFQNCTTSTCSTEMVTAFHLNQPIWDSAVVFDEPFLPNGGPVTLWRQPKAILVVNNRQTGQAFKSGQDYLESQYGLTPVTGGGMPSYANFQYASNPDTPANFQPFTKSNSPLRIDTSYQAHQLAVTYLTDSTAPGPLRIGSIPLFQNKISKGKVVVATFYGDSIEEGSNATATTNETPNQPGWVDLLGAILSKNGDGEYYWRNKSVGGWNSAEGLAGIESKVNTTASDLVVIGFGMNDVTANVTAPQFKKNILRMINAIRAKTPKTEIVLVSTWIGNPEWKPMNNNLLGQYRKALIQISKSRKGVAVADMTTLSKNILSRKTYYDVTSNGVNHPADWIHVAYAQVVARAIRGY